MTRSLAAIVLALLVAMPMAADAREGRGGGGGRGFGAPRSFHGGRGGGRHWRGGHHHHGFRHHRHHFGGSSLFFYGSFGPYWYSGWPYRPYWYPYYYAYPYPVPVPYRVDEDDEWDEPDAPAELPPPDDAEVASYGLIRLDGVPDGASVDLDGRFWLTADDLDDRWLALPRGEHRIAVRVRDGEALVRTIRIVPGKTHVVRFDARADRRT